MTSRHSSQVANRRHALGWVSIGLGTLQLAAPRAVLELSGLDDTRAARQLLALVGTRELLSGSGLLRGRRAAGWAWTRVAGDAFDLGALAVALARRPRTERRRLARVAAAVAAITAVDVVAALRSHRSSPAQLGLPELTATTTIRRPRHEVYEFWRRLENLPTFMAHLDDVVTVDDGRSRWRATAPFDSTVSWAAELTEDVPDTRVSWRSIGPTPVANSGSVTFSTAPDGISTELHVRLRYDIPGGRIGAAVAKYFGEEPHQQVDDDLRRLKQVMETGEVMRSDGALDGKRARHELRQRPAQPARAGRVLEAVS